MAKKKTEKAETSAAKPKKTTKPAMPAGNSGFPSIDTNLAASAAAKALAAGLGLGAAASGSPREESAGFKQLKAGLDKSSLGGGSSNLLNSLPGGKKSNQPFSGGKQVGRNQTFGADVNRTGVPRRTGGG